MCATLTSQLLEIYVFAFNFKVTSISGMNFVPKGESGKSEKGASEEGDKKPRDWPCQPLRTGQVSPPRILSLHGGIRRGADGRHRLQTAVQVVGREKVSPSQHCRAPGPTYPTPIQRHRCYFPLQFSTVSKQGGFNYMRSEEWKQPRWQVLSSVLGAAWTARRRSTSHATL